jgi:AcrR family transcriptional regulator
VRAAGELFYTHGVQGVGVDAVVARAGVAKASLYAHFVGKDDLIRAVLEEADDRDLARYRAVMDAAGRAPAARIDALFTALDALSSAPGFRGCAFVNAGLALPDPDHPAHAVVRRHKRRLRDLLVEQLEHLPRDDRQRAADALLLLVDASLVTGALRPDEHPALRARALAQLLMRGQALE